MCKNCGSDISSRESYCPNCGMELMVPYSKSLKEKYIAGEYNDRQEGYIPRNRRNQRETEEDYPDEMTTEAYENAPLEEYETEETGTSLVLVLFLFLIIALLVGFIFGFAIFSGILHSLPGLSNLGF